LARDVDVQIGAVRIDHGVALELVRILKLEELVCDCGLQDAQVDSIARIQFLGLEFPQPVLETAETLQFGIERKPAEIIRPAIIFMKTKPGCEDRKSTRLNSSHLVTSYAVFCLKKK